jgi:hypothetical protein
MRAPFRRGPRRPGPHGDARPPCRPSRFLARRPIRSSAGRPDPPLPWSSCSCSWVAVGSNPRGRSRFRRLPARRAAPACRSPLRVRPGLRRPRRPDRRPAGPRTRVPSAAPRPGPRRLVPSAAPRVGPPAAQRPVPPVARSSAPSVRPHGLAPRSGGRHASARPRRRRRARPAQAAVIRITRARASTAAHRITTARAGAATDRSTRAPSEWSAPTSSISIATATASAATPETTAEGGGVPRAPLPGAPRRLLHAVGGRRSVAP